MKNNLVFTLGIPILVIFLNLFAMQENTSLFVNQVMDSGDNQIRLKNYSGAIQLYNQGYKIKPGVDFKNRINKVQKLIYEEAIEWHGKGNFLKAKQGYDQILSTATIDKYLFKAVERNRSRAIDKQDLYREENYLREGEVLLDEGKADHAVELLTEGYLVTNSKIILSSLKGAGQKLLEETVTKHGKSDFASAITNYNQIMNSDYLHELKEEAKRLKSYADQELSDGDIIELAESYQKKDTLKAIEIYSDCLRIYPDSALEIKAISGMYKSASRFLEETQKLHREAKFEEAILGYEKILNLPYLSQDLISQAKVGLSLAKSKKKLGTKIAFLTFDDGPSINTLKILDILKKYNVKATFFVVGNSSDFGAKIYQRIISEGHVIGNHTYSHRYKKIYVSVGSFMEDFKQLEELLFQSVGIRPKILRFPGGSNNLVSQTVGGKQLMTSLMNSLSSQGYQYFDWNVNSKDADVKLQNTQVIIDSVLNASRGKDSIIVLMHDTVAKTTTPEALPYIIEGLKVQGFSFNTLP